MADAHFPGLTPNPETGLPVLTEPVLRMNGWLWVERIPALLKGKALRVEVIFLPPWEDQEEPQEEKG